MAESLEDRLRQVREDFVRGVPTRIAELLTAWDEADNWPERLKRAHHQAHRLAGGAGTLGQPDLGEAAKALELDFQNLIDTGAEPGAAAQAKYRERIARLAETIREIAQ